MSRETDKPKRRIVVVDTETSGLRDFDVAVEIAWWDLATDDRGLFVPAHDVQWVLKHGHPDALAINGYRERLMDAEQDDGTELDRLHHVLRGQVLAGSNPMFDAAHLHANFFVNGMHPRPWHHRLLDLSAYATGVLGLSPAELPGAATVAYLLGVPVGDHTAESDVRSTGLAFKALFEKAGV